MEKLKVLRESHHHSQRYLAERLNLQQEAISFYETGKRTPSLEITKSIAEFYQCSTDYLLDLTDIKTPVNQLLIDNLSPEEAEIINDYRKLSHSKKNQLIGYLKALGE